jgi:hypothetical protein
MSPGACGPSTKVEGWNQWQVTDPGMLRSPLFKLDLCGPPPADTVSAPWIVYLVKIENMGRERSSQCGTHTVYVFSAFGSKSDVRVGLSGFVPLPE